MNRAELDGLKELERDTVPDTTGAVILAVCGVGSARPAVVVVQDAFDEAFVRWPCLGAGGFSWGVHAN
jgi:hypothetical protein